MTEKTPVTMESLDKLLADKVGSMIAEAVAKAVGGLNTPQVRDLPLGTGGSIIRDRTFEIKPDQKGIACARMVRAIAFGHGDMQRAKYFVQNVYKDALGEEIQKAMTSSDPTSAGNLIIPEYAAEIIELLRSKTVVRRAGARTLPMNSGTLTLRKQTAGSSAAYVGESQNIGTTKPETGLLTLVSKKLAAIVPISNDLLTFASGPSADEFVRDNLVMEMSIREDRAFIRDDGTVNTPKGLRYWAATANVTASNGTTSTDIENDFKDLLNGLESADVRLLRPGWLMHPTRKNHLHNLRDANGNLIYPEIRQANPTLYTYPVYVTTSIPANLGAYGDLSEVYFVDFADALIGESTTLEIAVDSSAAYVEDSTVKSAFSLDETLVRAISRHDFAVRHRESVAVKTAVAWGG